MDDPLAPPGKLSANTQYAFLAKKPTRKNKKSRDSTTMIEKAKKLALSEHGDQTYGDVPYSVHLGHVAAIASAFGPVAEAAAWLHDVLEDTEISEEELEREVPKSVLTIVKLVTDADGPNRKTRKTLTYEKLFFLSDKGDEGLALLVKLADRLANVRNCVATHNWKLLNMYRKESMDFKTAVYRKSQPQRLWDELTKLSRKREKKHG